MSAGKGGEIAAVVTRAVDALDGYFSRYLAQLVLATAVPLALFVRLAWADWLTAVTIVVTLPLIPILMTLSGVSPSAE